MQVGYRNYDRVHGHDHHRRGYGHVYDRVHHDGDGLAFRLAG